MHFTSILVLTSRQTLSLMASHTAYVKTGGSQATTLDTQGDIGPHAFGRQHGQQAAGHGLEATVGNHEAHSQCLVSMGHM
jgi:hypothetical protein